VSLSTFYVFDKEGARSRSSTRKLPGGAVAVADAAGVADTSIVVVVEAVLLVGPESRSTFEATRMASGGALTAYSIG
jgi:hypothetical protein